MDVDLLLTHINAVNIHAGNPTPSTIVVSASSTRDNGHFGVLHGSSTRDNGHCNAHHGNGNNNDDSDEEVDNRTFTVANANQRPKHLPIAHLPPQPPPRGGQVRSPAHSPTSATPTLTYSPHRHLCHASSQQHGGRNSGVTLHPGSIHRNHQHLHPLHLPHQPLLQLPQLPTQYAAPLLYHMQPHLGSYLLNQFKVQNYAKKKHSTLAASSVKDNHFDPGRVLDYGPIKKFFDHAIL
nr:hypothetical protein BgiMline_032245 [Biomphalaria glabrata]